MMGLVFGCQLPVLGAFEKPPQLMQIASLEMVGHIDTSLFPLLMIHCRALTERGERGFAVTSKKSVMSSHH